MGDGGNGVKRKGESFSKCLSLLVRNILHVYRSDLAWGRGDVMVSALSSGSSGLGSSLSRGPCVVFLGKTVYSHSASLHPCVQMSTGEFNVGVALRWASIPPKGVGGR